MAESNWRAPKCARRKLHFKKSITPNNSDEEENLPILDVSTTPVLNDTTDIIPPLPILDKAMTTEKTLEGLINDFQNIKENMKVLSPEKILLYKEILLRQKQLTKRMYNIINKALDDNEIPDTLSRSRPRHKKIALQNDFDLASQFSLCEVKRGRKDRRSNTDSE